MTPLRELVVCSLEAWDDVWRRNQFLVDGLLHRYPLLRVLFVEPPADPLHALASGRTPRLPRLGRVAADRRLRTLRPLKPLPRRAGPYADRALRRQVRAAAGALRLGRPVLWLNDVTYAPLLEETGWPAVYDVTDDWLHAPVSPRELERLSALDRLALERADEVVVCSSALARSRGEARGVTLVPNAVDAAHFRRPQPRPDDLPPPPVAVYVGSLHDARLDVELVLETVRELDGLSLAFVGPDSLSRASRARLAAEPRVRLLGTRPYAAVPAYLQHADAIVVPHRVNEFTESLDPIKAYECLAVGTPTVATPVAGFRELEGALAVAPPDAFPAALRHVLAHRPAVSQPREVPSWEERTAAFAEILERVGGT